MAAVNHSWTQAKRAWASGALTPWERIGAVVAAGQLIRIVGLEATGAERALHDLAQRVSSDAIAATVGEPHHDDDDDAALTFFTVREDEQAAPRLVPETPAMREFRRRLTNK